MQCRRPGFDAWVGKIPWGRKWQPTPVFLPEEFHGQRSLVGYSPWVMKSQIYLSNYQTQKWRIEKNLKGGKWAVWQRALVSSILSWVLASFYYVKTIKTFFFTVPCGLQEP